MVQEKHGSEGTSKPRLKALLKAIKGVDPINYAPTLLDSYKGKSSTAEITPQAWSFFLTTIRDAAPDFPLIQAWRDTRDIKRKSGWVWPSYPTAYRRWMDLSEAQRLEARHGRADAIKLLTQPARRDKTSIGSLEWVSLDGRTQDFWVDWGDGRAVRPTVLMLVDVASNMILDWELAPSENAVSTVRIIKRTCKRYGIFDRLYTDNGTAFSGNQVAGGSAYRWRNGNKNTDGPKPLGICKIMGIDVKFALPRNARAKIVERTFASLSRVIDDRPEFKGTHTGHFSGASPDIDVVPIPVEVAMPLIQREIDRHNREPGRRSQGARGRSYEQVFVGGLEVRIKREATPRQLYLSGLIYSVVAVDRVGQVKKDNWVYGSPKTQDVMLRFHGSGQRILLGRDPDDFDAPAIAFDEAGQLICEGIEPVTVGAYDSVDGIRTAARNRKAASSAVAAGIAANEYLENADFTAALARLEAPEGIPITDSETVVAPRFGSPLRVSSQTPDLDQKNGVPEEFLKNMDNALAAKRARRGKSA